MNNENRIKISVVIPLYNKQKTIVNTINSVLNQTFKNFEIIIIDDGSNDVSHEMVSRINDERIKLYKKENGGVSSARNYGIEKSTGEFIYFLDADDIVYDDCFEQFINVLKENPEYLIIISNFKINYNNKLRFYGKKEKSGKIEKPFQDMWYNNIFPRMGSLLVHKSCLINNLFNESLSKYEDLDFVLRLLGSCESYYSSHAAFLYDTNHAQLSLNSSNLQKEFVSMIDLRKSKKYKKLILADNIAISMLRRLKNRDNYSLRLLLERNKNFLLVILFAYFYKKIILIHNRLIAN